VLVILYLHSVPFQIPIRSLVLFLETKRNFVSNYLQSSRLSSLLYLGSILLAKKPDKRKIFNDYGINISICKEILREFPARLKEARSFLVKTIPNLHFSVLNFLTGHQKAKFELRGKDRAQIGKKGNSSFAIET